MKLIFTDSEQLNNLLGFVDADLEYDKIKSDLYTATKELKALIGNEAYNYALSLHEKKLPTEEEAFHLYNFRYPIAVDAYRKYVPSGDLSHTNNGRKMRNDEYEKSAFEWMIARDNEALEKRYYKAVDNLLDFLDDENPVLVETAVTRWKDTEAFKKTHKLFVRSTSDFDNYFPINSRLLLLKLQPGLFRCENKEILSRIGKEKFDLLKSILSGENKTEILDETLLNLIQEACVYSALSWAMNRLRVTLLPEGILQRYSNQTGTSKASQTPSKMEAELTAQAFAADAEKVLKAIETYLSPLPTQEEIEQGNVFPGLGGCEDDKFFT